MDDDDGDDDGDDDDDDDDNDDDDDVDDELTNHTSGAHGDIGLAHQGTLEHLNTCGADMGKRISFTTTHFVL